MTECICQKPSWNIAKTTLPISVQGQQIRRILQEKVLAHLSVARVMHPAYLREGKYLEIHEAINQENLLLDGTNKKHTWRVIMPCRQVAERSAELYLCQETDRAILIFLKVKAKMLLADWELMTGSKVGELMITIS